MSPSEEQDARESAAAAEAAMRSLATKTLIGVGP